MVVDLCAGRLGSVRVCRECAFLSFWRDTSAGTVNYREPSAPTIEASMEDVEVNEGASAMLELKITGWPKPRILWYEVYDNKVINTTVNSNR